MSKAIDITGQRFGRLVAIRPTEERRDGKVLWECQCDCGNITKVRQGNLSQGLVRSCGCLRKEVAVEVGRSCGAKTLEKGREEMCVEGTRLDTLKQKISKNNTSGVKGVAWNRQHSRWEASIMFKGKATYLGRYDNVEDAAKARKAAEEKYFKPILEKYGMAVSD